MILCVSYDLSRVQFLTYSFYYLLYCNYRIIVLGDCGHLAVCREKIGSVGDVEGLGVINEVSAAPVLFHYWDEISAIDRMRSPCCVLGCYLKK